MGRPRAEDPKTPVTVTLKSSTVKEIDRIAKKLDFRNRSEFVGNLIEVGLDDAKIFDKFGIYSVVMNVGKAARKLRGKTLSEKITWDEAGDIVEQSK